MTPKRQSKYLDSDDAFFKELEALFDRHNVHLEAGYDQELLLCDDAGGCGHIEDFRHASQLARVRKVLAETGPLPTFTLDGLAECNHSDRDQMVEEGHLISAPGPKNAFGVPQNIYSLPEEKR